MSELIQDQQFKRVLDALGLRGTIQHLYEPHILPVVSLGDIPSPTIAATTSGAIVNGNPIWTVPTGESWEVLYATGFNTQAAGTVAPQLGIAIFGFVNGAVAWFPWHRDTLTVGENLTQVFPLNVAARWFCRFPPKTLPGPNQTIGTFSIAGDGTISTLTGALLVYRRWADPLLAIS